MVLRLSSREKNIPWFLHDKLKCYSFCRENDLATAVVLREFNTPDEMTLAGLPDDFVIKPSGAHSSRGVMVLTRTAEGFHDHLRNRPVTTEEVLTLQAKHYEETKFSFNKIIVEEKIVDKEGFAVPRDYKAYAFHGNIALILEINRNTKPPTVGWFDGEFQPVTDGRVTSNPKLVTERPATRPADWDSVLAFARKVSLTLPTPFASIDMYSTPKGPIVGEVTLAPGGLYFGNQFTLSTNLQATMGQMWSVAAEELGIEPVTSPPERS